MSVIYQAQQKHIVPETPCYIFNNLQSTSQWILDGDIPEKNLIEWAMEFVNKDSIFVDIGAHVGTWSIPFALKCKKVYAFEAQRDTFYKLCGGIALNNLDNVYAHNYGLCAPEENEEYKLLQVDTLDGGSSSFLPENKNMKSIIKAEYVKMQSLDKISSSVFHSGRISLVKIDVEGMELQVLQGAIETLKAHGMPKIIFEAWSDEWYEPKKNALFDFLKLHGYRIFPITSYNHMFLASH